MVDNLCAITIVVRPVRALQKKQQQFTLKRAQLWLKQIKVILGIYNTKKSKQKKKYIQIYF